MVTRLILLIILGFAAALYFPDSRQMMSDLAMPVIHPMLVGSAEREIDALSRAVRREARETYQLPQTRSWDAWLVANFTDDGVTDPWGKTYFLPGLARFLRDSIGWSRWQEGKRRRPPHFLAPSLLVSPTLDRAERRRAHHD